MGDLPLWVTVVGAIAAVANVTLGIWVYVAAARQRAITALETKVRELAAELANHKDDGARSRGELRDRLVHVEEQLAHMPTAESQHRLELRLAELSGAVATIGEALKPLARTSVRIEDYLMSRNESK